MKNPFTLTFGKKPFSYISREAQLDEIINDFLDEVPVSNIYMLNGPHGSGKTVSLREISSFFKTQKDWIVIDLNPERDLFSVILTSLLDLPVSGSFPDGLSVNISLPVISAQYSGRRKSAGPATEGRFLLKKLSKTKRVLFTIDEVSATQSMKEFAAEFQIWLRDDYPVFLLMAGLDDNIRDLQNEKTLTFLYRVPLISLKPLDSMQMSREYERLLNLQAAEASEMASLTSGYPYAYQMLGYCSFKYAEEKEKIFEKYDLFLRERCYEKMWSELGPTDQSILETLAKSENGKIIELRQILDMDSRKFSVYRKRLIDKGLLKASARGVLTFSLPRFKEFICWQIDQQF